MHYQNGRPAILGDEVIGRDHSGRVIAGKLVSLNPGSETCNGRILPTNVADTLPFVTLSQLHHADDALPTPAAPAQPA